MRPGSHEHPARKPRIADSNDFQRPSLDGLADLRDLHQGFVPDVVQEPLQVSEPVRLKPGQV